MIVDRTKWFEPAPGWRGELALFVRWGLVRYAGYAAFFVADRILRRGRSLAWQALGYAMFEGVVVFAWVCGVAYRARRAHTARADEI